MKQLIAFVTFCFSLNVFSQDYFQQDVKYTIEVTLDDKEHILTANETIEYKNNSPDELKFIYMHLWPNAYKNNETAMAQQLFENGGTRFYYAEEKDRGYIDDLDFKVNGSSVNWEYDSVHIDICKIMLSEPLKSGESITISTPFKVKIPKGVYSRLGHMGETYQITQWYPKPAVYDKDGWHPMPYLSQGEFYSEFGSFDVSLTLPKNYVVGATGDFVDGQDELDWLNYKAEQCEKQSFEKKKTSRRQQQKKMKDEEYPPSSSEMKTLHYRQDNVHDFAWFADKRWHVQKGEVKLPHSGRTVTTWAMFTDAEPHLWKDKSIEYLNDAIYYYSLWNGDYPYDHMTAVDGALTAGGGMEYPNITVIGTSGSPFSLETVIMHETGHQWFYGILGSNERLHPWMDEGLNSFNENRYIETKYSDSALILGFKKDKKIFEIFDLNRPHKDLYYYAYLLNARRNLDQPIEEHSTKYASMNYGTIVYMKTAVTFDYLMAYLGEDTFDRTMQRYFNEWKFKHPQPGDLQKIFEDETNKNLSWFFEDMIQTTKKLDYKIVKAKKEKFQTASEVTAYKITIKNAGEIKGPYQISGIRNDSIVETKWFDGFEGTKTIIFPDGDFEKLKIDATYDMPELDKKNNTINTKGLCKKSEPLRLQFIASLENSDKKQLLYTPIFGWNEYNHWMLGLALYNSRIPQRKFDYTLAPMYSFSTGSVTGYADMFFNCFPKGKLFQSVRYGISGKSYAINGSNPFYKITPELKFEFKNKDYRSFNSNYLTLRSVNVVEEYSTVNQFNQFNEIGYSFSHAHTLNPFWLDVNVQYGMLKEDEGNGYTNDKGDFLKAWLVANQRIEYNSKGKEISIRFFAGKYFTNTTNNGRYNWRMDGFSGSTDVGHLTDYAYDYTFLGRSETDGVLSQQFVEGQGGFKTRTFVGSTNDWLVALNIKADLPFPLPIGIFADFGYNNYSTFVYDAGIHVWLSKGVFDVYIPLNYSQNIKDVPGFDDLSFGERIRFTVNLHKINPFNIVRNFDM